MYYDAKNTGVNLDIDEAGSGYFDESRLTEHWAYDALEFCLKHGYLSYEEDGRVRPNKPITRGEFGDKSCEILRCGRELQIL